MLTWAVAWAIRGRPEYSEAMAAFSFLVSCLCDLLIVLIVVVAVARMIA